MTCLGAVTTAGPVALSAPPRVIATPVAIPAVSAKIPKRYDQRKREGSDTAGFAVDALKRIRFVKSRNGSPHAGQ